MIVDVKRSENIKIDIGEIEALNLLCKVLQMEFALDEDTDYSVCKGADGNNAVYLGGCKVDDRGDLFIALRNVAVNLVPNVMFRSADYIYGNNV